MDFGFNFGFKISQFCLLCSTHVDNKAIACLKTECRLGDCLDLVWMTLDFPVLPSP